VGGGSGTEPRQGRGDPGYPPEGWVQPAPLRPRRRGTQPAGLEVGESGPRRGLAVPVGPRGREKDDAATLNEFIAMRINLAAMILNSAFTIPHLTGGT
jgi:hypothetical protein